jgi:acyl-coenzyme A synthetase/AMP-(fatty) acid ligase
MNTAHAETPCLKELVTRRPGLRLRALGATLRGRDIGSSTIFANRRCGLAGKSVLIGARSQIVGARALIELDGLAARLVICPPDFSPRRLASVIAQAEVDVIVSDAADKDFGVEREMRLCGDPVPIDEEERFPRLASQWVLPTSGTTGEPKLVAHRLEGLFGAIRPASKPIPVWATFYDIRRYGGLQIFLRACIAGAQLLLADKEESLGDYMARCAKAGVSHISGTPSHWRRLLMSPHAGLIDPKYVRLSGEIADRAILDALRAVYPKAAIAHAYASTEAGVGFEVADGREGFPAALLASNGEVELRLRDGSLHVRSKRTATSYVGRDDLKLLDDEGFVDTDDMVEQKGDRCFFKGRRAGVINVGGLKVHPEEVEQVINEHRGVRVSRVSARRNPIMGDLIVAEVTPTDAVASGESGALEAEIFDLCRARLPRHMVPVTIRFVPAIDILASGKLARRHA